MARRLGLSEQATQDLQSLFGGPSVIRSSTTWVGATVTLLSAYAWPTALQKGYELAWQLPSRGLRDIWRPLVWLAAVLAAAAALVVLGGVVQGDSALPALLLVPPRVRLVLVDPAPAARRLGSAGGRCSLVPPP